MAYEDIDEKLIKVECGDFNAYREIIIEGCGSLYLYASMIKDSKADRIRLVRETYMIAWNRLIRLEMTGRFDIWLKSILWQHAAVEEGKTEAEVREFAEDKVNLLLKSAFREAENYWYLPSIDRQLLAASIVKEIKGGNTRKN